MLLTELIQTATHYKKASRPYDPQKQANKADVTRLSNSPKVGGYGRVMDRKKDPFTIDKVPHESKPQIELNDKYLYYIKAVKDEGVAEGNPFFPRIYEYHVYTDKNGNQKYKVNMEKLQVLSDTNHDEVDAIMDRLFKPDFLSKVVKYDKNATMRQLRNDGKFSKFDYFNTAMRQAFNYPPAAIADDKFYEAVMWLKGVKDGIGTARWDVHMDNFMLRRTPAGSQLVIVDPLT